MSKIPYPGLRPFKREESNIFFGREEQTDQLLEKLSQTRFISVVGLSGCGKSSLVRAGMIAALETGYLSSAGAQWQVVTMRPGNYPLHNLASALLGNAVLGPGRMQSPEENSAADVERLSYVIASQGPLGLMEILRDTPLPAQTNLLLLVDQFEEIFRYRREGAQDDAEAFVNLLLTSAEQREVPIYVVTTMRSDFIGNCTLFRNLPEMMNNGQFLVPRLTREQQQKAIIGPARVFGSDIEPRLVNRLLNEMGTDPDQLPLLQHCLMRMWLRAGPKAGGQESLQSEINITLEDYETIGGLENALSNHADEAYKELDEEGQRVAEIMFRCLSERDPNQHDIRHPTPLSEIAAVAGSASKVREVMEVFRRSDRCFLTPAAGISLASDTMLDISHESLIRQWQRMNGWVEQEAWSAGIYRSLEKRAYTWKQTKHDPKWLWDNPDLEIALKWKEKEKPTSEWARRYGGDFGMAMEFLNASKQAQEEKEFQEEQDREEKRRQQEQAREEKRRREEQERERQRELKFKYARQLLIMVVVALIIAIGLAVWAFWERGKAQGARQRMRELTQQALDVEERAKELKQRAEEMQKKAELNSSVIQTVVNATFGFLLEVKQTEEFLKWFDREELPVESLDRTLVLMIESSTGMNEEQKQTRLDDLSTMTREAKNDLLGELAIEAANRARVAVNISVEPDIRNIYIGLEEEIALSATTNKPNLQVNWERTGPGKLINKKIDNRTDDPEALTSKLYIPPDVISSKSEQVVITVTVTDDQRRTATDEVIFTLLPSTLEILSTEQLVEMAENSFKYGYLTTPKEMNAFDICKEIFKRDSKNGEVKKIVLKIAERYKIWGDPKYEQAESDSKEKRYNQTVISKAKIYYERYVTVAKYIEKDLRDSSVKSDRKKVERRLKNLKKWEKKLSQKR